MSNKTVLIFTGIFFFFSFHISLASVLINEAQLAPAGERFIELYNNGSSSVDLTDWYIQRKTETGSDFSSLISKTYFENKTIGGGEYFLISRSLSGSNITYSGMTLTSSNSIQLKDSGGNVVSKLSWGNSPECSGSCPENPPDGKSIQRTPGGSWVSGTPTPGSENINSNENNSEPNNENNQNITDEQIVVKDKKIFEVPSIKIKLSSSPSPAFVGQPVLFQASVSGYTNEKIVLGKLFWNFGDGGSLEQVDKFEKFGHIYYYPGEYILTLEYYSDRNSPYPETTVKNIVKVVPVEIVISRVGDQNDFFIELSNTSKYDVDLSGWILRADQKIFVFPKNSMILAGKKIIVSEKTTGFSLLDGIKLGLFDSFGKLVFDYNSKNLRRSYIKPAISKQVASAQTAVSDLSENKNNPADNTDNSISEVESVNYPEEENSNSLLFFAGLATLLVVAGGVVYFIRKTKTKKLETGEDFDIIDE